MAWNWQCPDWPQFIFNADTLAPLERQFLRSSGEFIGAFRHIGPEDQDALRIELISDEALKTSAIEGEILNRDSVQSSLRRQFGLGADFERASPTERGIAEMMVDVYRSFAAPLDHQTLFAWHRMLMSGQSAVDVVGAYRQGDDPMQVVSGAVYARKIHFEAPPSKQVPDEMRAFISWFNETASGGSYPLPALTRAGMAHFYFVSVHPFEDGNGRIGRALSEKCLAQSLGQPSLIALAYTIERGRKAYYRALERNNKDTEITDWLAYFAGAVLQAQATTIARVDFYVAKARFYDRFRGQLNERQGKAVARMFQEGIDGFKGGLSAENYVSITGTSRATATRDLQDLVGMGALSRTGELKGTRYHLALEG